MKLGATGLTGVSDKDLRALLRAVHRGDIACPLTLPELARNGLQHAAEELEALRGLDAAAVRACTIVALAERQAAQERADRLARAAAQAVSER
ncbi:MAG: hypothetical protein H6732_13625 [Alphaproteobacteria bacterium]|nr:hypothetical protein [Alphaproteobacteria bacterium]